MVRAGASWAPDEALAGYEARTLALRDDGDQPVATLVRPARDAAAAPTSRVLLRLHGFSDYFFHPHLFDAYAAHGYATYALELRRYGRSLRPGQEPFRCRSIDDYFEEVTAAVDVATAEATGPVVVHAHSTGGLVAALYAARGERRDRITALVLDSPFLALNLPAALRRVAPGVAALGRVAPGLPVARLPGVHARSLHRAHGGEWLFDTTWKPTGPVVVRAGWLHAIVAAQAELRRGLGVACPVLVMRSTRSRRALRAGADLRAVDAVLDVADIERLAPCIGPDVTQAAVEGAGHDLLLSPPDVRARALAEQLGWLAAHGLA